MKKHTRYCECPVSDLGLSARVFNAITHYEQIGVTVGDIKRMFSLQLARTRGLGPKGIREIKKALRDHNCIPSIPERLEALGPGWVLSMSDPGGWGDSHRWWVYLPTELGGTEQGVYMAETPDHALDAALLGEKGEL